MPYINCFKNKRLHSEIGDIPPAELEATYYAHLRSTTQHQPTRDVMQKTGRLKLSAVGRRMNHTTKLGPGGRVES